MQPRPISSPVLEAFQHRHVVERAEAARAEEGWALWAHKSIKPKTPHRERRSVLGRCNAVAPLRVITAKIGFGDQPTGRFGISGQDDGVGREVRA